VDIALVVPINRTYVIVPRLGLGYLAALARRAGHRVAIVDCLKEDMSHGQFEGYLRSQSFDLVGFQLFSYDLPSVERHLAAVKRWLPEAVTIAGGPHPSGAPAHTLHALPQLDYAMRGEAELGFPMLLDTLATSSPALSAIPGLVYRADGGIRVNPTGCVEDLDSLPLPAWDLAKPETYPEAPHGAFTKRFPTAPIVMTRGCPFQCTFCSGTAVSGRSIRKRSVDAVLDELRVLRARGIREFHIEDENFTAHRKLVLEFCRRLQKARIDMSWSLPAGVRIDSLDRPLLEAMAAAGCYSLALGIEFGSQRMMDLTRKRLSLDLVRQKVELLHDLPIKTTGFFLFGVPGETLAEMRRTAEFARELPLDRAQFNNFIPLPGSALWEELSAADKLSDLRWERFYVHDVPYADDGIEPRALKRLRRQAYLRFYLRPRVLRNLMAEVRSARHLQRLLRRLLDALS